MTPALDALTRINLDDLVNAFGLQHRRAPAALLRALFHRTAQDFARQMLAFDDLIGVRGLAQAACITERLYVRDVRLFGAENLPEGPCIILSNHPGVTDTLALFAAVGLPDLRVIALDRPFLLSLPNLTRQLFFVTDLPQERASLVRHVRRHLQAGGSVLTFPAGHTEPDPDVYPGAIKSLASWTESAGALLRFSPEVAIVPVCVRGVSWRATARSSLARLRRSVDDQQLLASVMQLVANVAFGARPVIVKVEIGRPIRAAGNGGVDSASIHRAVLTTMEALIENPPEGSGVGVL
jgi:1-acyl-sn-glycerol-3-phosphate acyltransferase